MAIAADKMKSPILPKFACCCELRTGGFIMGIIDSLVYGVLLVIFSAQIFFDIGFIDNEHGERSLLTKRALRRYLSYLLLSLLKLTNILEFSRSSFFTYRL